MTQEEKEPLEQTATDKLSCLMMNNPVEFIEGIILMAKQECFDLIQSSKGVVIPIPKRPGESDMTLKIKTWMALVKDERKAKE